MRGILRIAWRNLGRHPRRTAVITSAVVVGLAGTVLSMALNAGMVFQMVETAIATELGHLQIRARGYQEAAGLGHELPEGGRVVMRVLQSLDGVRGFAPRVRAEGLLYSPRASFGVRILGVDPALEPRVSRVPGSLVEGVYLGDVPRRLVLGETLAQRLQVGVRDKLVLSTQDATGNLTGEAFRVAGIFRTASSEFDGATVFLRLDEAQALLALGERVTEVVVLAERGTEVEALQSQLAARLGPEVEVTTWREAAPLLDYMVQFFDETAWLVYLAVFVAMAFGIANVLLMSVYERRRELGVLMAVGMRPRRVVALVVAESLALTALGVTIGFFLALAGTLALRDGVDLSLFAEGLTAFGIGTRVVPVVRAYDLLVPSVVALGTALLASLWPALHAARARPAEALRQL